MGKIPTRLALKYYWDAQTIFSAHSPFVYHFMKEVMNTKHREKDVYLIESKRKELLGSNDEIAFIELGAGSSKGSNTALRKISDVALNSLSGSWQCQIMYNLVQHYGIENILEIGTSLGISTAYFAFANREANIITLEGNPSSVDIAKDVWNKLNIDTIDVRLGEFGETMNKAAEDIGNIDLAFIDGNHRKDATMRYFHDLKSRTKASSIFIIDDIYWSTGMNEAWNEIINDESVAFSIDLFRMGIVFFDHSIMPKQHYKLIPYKFKPWSIGLFG
jgi:predicted O-methyltransferase YrrM